MNPIKPELEQELERNDFFHQKDLDYTFTSEFLNEGKEIPVYVFHYGHLLRIEVKLINVVKRKDPKTDKEIILEQTTMSKDELDSIEMVSTPEYRVNVLVRGLREDNSGGKNAIKETVVRGFSMFDLSTLIYAYTPEMRFSIGFKNMPNFTQFKKMCGELEDVLKKPKDEIEREIKFAEATIRLRNAREEVMALMEKIERMDPLTIKIFADEFNKEYGFYTNKD